MQAIADIIQEAFLRHTYSEIETHLGSLFRTSWFNIASHRYLLNLENSVLSKDLLHTYSCMARRWLDTIRTSTCLVTHSSMACRQEVPQLVDVVPLQHLVELRQGMSRKDLVAAKKLNALNSRMECPNYRVRQAEQLVQDALTACTSHSQMMKASQRAQLQSVKGVLTTSHLKG